MPAVETFNEFCFIIWYYVPEAYRLYLRGELEYTKSKLGTSSLFYFSPNHIEESKHNWAMIPHEPFYTHTNSLIDSIEGWCPPPYKEYFSNDLFVYDKPILTINNKSTIEWERGLYNYFNLDSLKKIFETFYDKFQIIYIKPPSITTTDYQHDAGVNTQDIGDYDLIRQNFPEIITIQDLQSQYSDKSYNELQMMALANSNHHLASAGGEAAIASYFGGTTFIYRHPTAPSHNRKVWHTGSYLKKYSKSNIIGHDRYESLIDEAKELWI